MTKMKKKKKNSKTLVQPKYNLIMLGYKIKENFISEKLHLHAHQRLMLN